MTRSKTYIFNGRRLIVTTAFFFATGTSTRSVLTAGQLVAAEHRREGGGVWGCAPKTPRMLKEHIVGIACYHNNTCFQVFNMHNVQMFFGCFEFLKRTLDITILVQSLLTKKHLTVVGCFSLS